MHAFVQDLRYAVRGLRRSPGFTAVAVLTLALGIGANTAIFSIVNAVLLSPLPFSDADRLVVVRATDRGRTMLGPSPADGLDYARRNHTLERFAMFDYWRKNVSGVGNMAPEEMPVGLTPADYFEALGITPIIGRLFTPDENRFGNHYVAIVSASFWRDRFASDPHVAGRTVRINDEPYTVVGVVPDAIPLWMTQLAGKPAQIWTPMAPYANFFDESTRGSRGVDNVARLKPGVSIAQAQADLDVIAKQLAQEYPVDAGAGVEVRPLAGERSGPLRSSLLLLLGAVGLILLIACSNVANLLLVRNSGRRREFAIRVALGGVGADVIRQPLLESAVLAVAGGAAGVVLAAFAQDVMLRVRPDRLPQLAGAAIDGRVLAFTALVSVAVTILFGLSPALTTARVDVVEGLRDGARGATHGPGRRRLRGVLVASEIAFSLMLMIAAGLLVRSVARLQAQELGFRSDHLFRAHLYLPPARYLDSPTLTRFADSFAARVREIPGVRDSSITSLVTPENRWEQPFSVIGQPIDRPEELPRVNFVVADDHLLGTFGIPLLRGRNFAATDLPTEPAVALVNQALVRQFFPNEDPIGRRVHLGQPGVTPISGSAQASGELTIVGVIGDIRNRGLAQPIGPQVVALYRQMPGLNFGFKEIYVRTAQDPYAVTGAIGDVLRRMDPEMPLAEVSSVDDMVVRDMADRWFTTALLGLFAALGVALALVGVYGVVAYLASERTHEIGIRVALGATRGRVVWLVTWPALAMATVGAAIGLAAAWELRRLLDAVVFGVSTADPATFVGGTALLMCAVAAASAIPARRATRISPIRALRED